MIRKTVLAIAAAATIGAVALAPTAASAHHFHHHHGLFGLGFWGIDAGPECYLVKQETRRGYRYVQVCS